MIKYDFMQLRVKSFFLILDEKWIERGCTLDRKANLTSKSDNDMLECKEAGCNRNNVVYSNCIFCDSQDDNECYALSNPKNFTIQCIGTYTYSKRGCFTLRIGI